MSEVLDQISDEKLEQILKERKEAKRKRQEKERREYEGNRDSAIASLIVTAIDLSQQLAEFKRLCHEQMSYQEEKLNSYGAIRSNSKGGFSITNSEGTHKIVRRRDTEPKWDERAGKGSDLIKDFLLDTVKKKDKDLFEILMSFLERNEKGDLEFAKVFSLLKHRDRYTDERWLSGLQLIEESFSNHLKGYGFEFKIIGEESGKWESIPMNFSAL